MKEKLEQLARSLKGDLHADRKMRILYATDASAYREMPLAVAIPRDKDDIRKLIDFARMNGTSLIPRTAGTSLAGQVVGSGIVVDAELTSFCATTSATTLVLTAMTTAMMETTTTSVTSMMLSTADSTFEGLVQISSTNKLLFHSLFGRKDLH